VERDIIDKMKYGELPVEMAAEFFCCSGKTVPKGFL